MAPKMSVIMSAYNSSETIERAINSILGQTFTDFELIVLNDGSTDDTEAKVLSFTDERIKYHRLEHAGLTKALNFGVAQAEAEFIARHDSDDWSEPERFAIQLSAFEDDEELSLVSSWHNVVDVDGNHLGLKPTATDDSSLKLMMGRRNPFCHGTVVARKSSLEAVGGYNEALLFSQDYDLWLRMTAIGMRFACVPQALYNYSITPDSIAKGWQKLGYAKKIRQDVSRSEGEPGFSVGELPEIGRRRTQSLWNYALGSLALDDGRRGRAVSYFVRSLLSDPLQWRAYLKFVASLLPASLARIFFGGAKKLLELKNGRQ